VIRPECLIVRGLVGKHHATDASRTRAVLVPEVGLKLPFAFPLAYRGNACNFSRDLSIIVYARPGGQADVCLLSPQ
jgi:hypothetical protein